MSKRLPRDHVASAFLRRFRLHDRGAAMLEFAFVAAPTIALMLASLETALVYFTQEGIETAAEAAARSVMIGQVSSTASSAGYETQAQFQKAACTKLPAYLTCGKLMVDVQTADSFANVNTTAPAITFDKNGNVTNSFAYSTGTTGDIVILRLMYIWPVPKGPLGFDLSNLSSGRRLLIATEVFKSEPYAVSSTGL